MKYISALCLQAFVLAVIFTVNFSRAQSAGSGYVVTARGPDYAIHQKTTVENGVNRVHQYTELATGLNYTNSSGQLVPAVEEIDILPNGGAVANHGRHTVSFPGDIYTGKIEVVTPDGLHLKSRPLAISYDDGTNTVLIGVLTNASGFVVGSNQVVYPNAFSGLNADVRYTYRKGGFEQDIMLNEQPPAPEAFGLTSQTVHLQVLTEFFNPPEPKQTKTNLNSKASRQAVSSDTTLTFGKMKMIHGKAFAIGSSGGDSAQTNRSRFTSAATRNSQPSTLNSQPVSKSWVHLQGRTFLVEELPVPAIAAQLQQLPVSAAVSMNSASPLLHKVSATRLLPPERPVQESTVQLAKADLKYKSGVVLDYIQTLDDNVVYFDNFTFSTGTWLLDKWYEFTGSLTFQGGAVIKFDTQGGTYGDGGIDTDMIDGETLSFSFPTDPANPVIFTVSDDDTVGETIDDSDHNPTNSWYNIGGFNCSGTVQNARFRYIYGFSCQNGTGLVATVINCEFWYCYDCCEADILELHNVLFAHCQAPNIYSDSDLSINAEHLTVDGSPADYNYTGVTGLTNCLFTTNTWVSVNGGTWTNAGASIYHAGGYYLATSSPYRNAGTTNISPDLLAELQTMTTYAPQDGGYPDTNTPDLGYHYPVNEDSDHDGLPDWWEWQKFGNFDQTGSGDYDGDGYSNLQEYLNGSNPADPASVPFKVFITRPRNGSVLP